MWRNINSMATILGGHGCEEGRNVLKCSKKYYLVELIWYTGVFYIFEMERDGGHQHCTSVPMQEEGNQVQGKCMVRCLTFGTRGLTRVHIIFCI
jgi:hypothetical protein